MKLDWSPTVANPTALDEQKFEALADEWRRTSRLHSNVSKKVTHPAYQKIIGMGPVAIPLILGDLVAHGPDDWFWALSAITEENPITADMTGNMNLMTEAWLKWGRDKGYLTG